MYTTVFAVAKCGFADSRAILLMANTTDAAPNGKAGSLLLAWQVKNKHCLVIGAGDVALSRIHHLVVAQAKITVVTGEGQVHPEIVRLQEDGALHRFVNRNFEVADLSMYDGPLNISAASLAPADYPEIDRYVHNNRFEVVCCCIDDHELSTQIYYQCKLLRINANIADKPSLCDFYFGSMINKDNLQIMISTNGKSPRLARIIKNIIAQQLDGIDLNKAIENLNFVRFYLRNLKLPENDVNTIEKRMTWIKDLTDFFSIRQWSELDINETNVVSIVDFYPEYPPKDYEEFKLALQGLAHSTEKLSLH